MLQALVNISLEKFQYAEKEKWAMQNLFMKEREKILKKWTSVQDI